MTLLELFQKVREPSLTREQLEEYRDALCNLYAEINVECADLEKKEALYFMAQKTPEISDVGIKRMWRVTTEGQRLILLNRYIKASAKVIDSLKSRIYATIM